MRKTFLLLLFFLNFSAQAEKISQVNISGNNTVSRGTVLNSLLYEVGDNVEEINLTQMIKSLYQTGLFKDVGINFKNGELNINLIENPIIKYIDILDYDDGEVLSIENLDSMKKNFKFESGKTFIEREYKKFLNVIKELYKDNGFYNLSIEEKFDLDEENRIGITLKISENEKALITSFNFSGNSFFSDSDIVDFFEIGEPDFFILNFFTQKDSFNLNLFNAGLENLKQKYLDAGFLDFQILNEKIQVAENGESIEIEIKILEGNRYKFGNINLFGNFLEVGKSNAVKKIQFSKGDFFDRKKLINSLNDIEDLFANYGYAQVKIDAKINDSDKEFADIDISLIPEDRFYVRRITITGNNTTQDDVIRREFDIIEGQLYSKNNLDESIKKIKRLGYFSDVRLSTQVVEGSVDQIDVFLEVEETKTGTISFGISHSNSSGSSITAGIQQRNIFGTGNTFNGSFSNSEAVKDFSFFFSDPYFLDKKQTLRYGVFSKSTDGSQLDVSSYLLDENGFNIGYSAPVTKDLELGTDLRISKIDLQCGALLSTSSYEESDCASSDVYDFVFSVNGSLNTLNDYYFPTEGKQFYNKLSIALPAGDYQYYQINSSYKHYTPIGDNLTFKFSTKFDLATGYGGKNLPFYKRYFAGGSSSVRGFDFNSIGAKYANGLAKGGELSLLSNTSVISPFSLVKDSENMRIGGFVDLGGISEKMSEFDPGDLRASTGIAFTWLTPIGPIGVNAAAPLIKKTNDNISNFNFTLGSSF